MRTVYIAYSMTNNGIYNPKSNDGKKSEIFNQLSSWFKRKKFKVLKPSLELFPKEIASHSLEKMDNTRLFIADVSIYSHGVGFELGYCYANKKDIIVIAQKSKSENISKFIIGLFPNIIFYDGIDDLIESIDQQLTKVMKK
ncbi:MAG: hypothetical protein GY795_02385 [Desulfobacterales bacterium]|nr:hypothetical protein [Desulfobacterales bacterium]